MSQSSGALLRRFELRHLRYFKALATERNFSRAADKLGIAQPGLSQQIINLEAIVGTSLLDRRRRAVALTTAGEVFLLEAERILAQAESAVRAAQRAGRGEIGHISVGYVASAAYTGILTSALGRFRGAHPDVKLHIVAMEVTAQLENIAGGSLDVGYFRLPAKIPPTVATEIILREPLLVALPRDHCLAAKASVPLRALAGDTFITLRQAADVGFHQIALRACRNAGFAPIIEAIGYDFTGIISQVAIGLGVALVPRSLKCMSLPGLVYRPITGTRTTTDLAIAYRRNELSPTVKVFINQREAISAVKLETNNSIA